MLTGTVRRVGNQVRGSVELLDARTGASLGARVSIVTSPISSPSRSALAQEITGALKATFTAGERALIERKPTQNQEAYEFYLRGLVLEGLSTRAKREKMGIGSLQLMSKLLRAIRPSHSPTPGWSACRPWTSIPHGLQAAYDKTMEAGDYPAVSAVLADRRLNGVVGLGYVIRDPIPASAQGDGGISHRRSRGGASIRGARRSRIIRASSGPRSSSRSCCSASRGRRRMRAGRCLRWATRRRRWIGSSAATDLRR